jgi:hypothetical protein
MFRKKQTGQFLKNIKNNKTEYLPLKGRAAKQKKVEQEIICSCFL